jgi:hypothetical protein
MQFDWDILPLFQNGSSQAANISLSSKSAVDPLSLEPTAPLKNAPSPRPLEDTLPASFLFSSLLSLRPENDSHSENILSKDSPREESPRNSTPRKDSLLRDSLSEDFLSEDSQRKESPSEDSPRKDSPIGNSPRRDSPSEDSLSGVPLKSGKIVGGSRVERGQFPFMVSLMQNTGSSHNRYGS